MSDLAIVIPTLGRAHKLQALRDNIFQTTPLGTDVVLVVDDDDIDTLKVLEYMEDIRVVFGENGYPGKANAGFIATNAPLVLIAGDDVRFHKGWYEAALEAFDDPDVCVVGPNDLSPTTQEGNVATMPIVRRSYIEQDGGAWRAPGLIYFEGYHHNYTDAELWHLAQHRGVARYVEDCIIEHLHPDWGKAEDDDTYRRGARTNFKQDEVLYHARKEQWST